MKRPVLFLLIAYALLLIFAHLDDHQLEYYDEARRGVNAIEMARGESPLLVPTYNGTPDKWGTKPPLLVWLQSVFIRLFGIGELAVRLPAALASVALLALLTWWGKKDWGSPLVGVLATLIVFSSYDYMGTHGARSGDYDALLVLFLTAQLVFFYRWVNGDKLTDLGLAALAVVLAGWTKGIAGCFFLPGVGLWFLLDGRARKKLLRPELYLLIGGALLMVLSYYFLRERQEPGFLTRVQANELGGRFGVANEGHDQPWYYYLERLLGYSGTYLFVILTPAAVAATYFLRSLRSLRSLGVLVGLTLVVQLTVIGLAATKLYWYVSPALPLIGLLSGSLLFYLAGRLAEASRQWVGVALLFCVFAYPLAKVTEQVFNPREHMITPDRKIPYRDFIRDTRVEPPYTVLALAYNPNARFYVERARSRGEEVDIAYARIIPFPGETEPTPRAKFTAGQRVAVCATETWDFVFKRYRIKELYQAGRCKLVEIKGEREDR